MIDLAGKTAVVFGLANKRSIAWGIAQKLHAAGATLAICYQNERMKLEAADLINELPGASGFQCDVSVDAEIETLFAALKEKYGKLDILVHAVAYAPADDLRGEFVNTSREGFRIALDVSVYSLIAVTRAAAPLMTEGGSIVTLTYFAAEKVVPHYNVMARGQGVASNATVRYLAWNLGSKNIRVNAISAGPIKTLAARGVGDLGEMLKTHADRAPLHRNVDQLEVGGAALFLASDLWPAPSPAKPSTSIAATTSWGFSVPIQKFVPSESVVLSGVPLCGTQSKDLRFHRPAYATNFGFITLVRLRFRGVISLPGSARKGRPRPCREAAAARRPDQGP